MSESCIRKLKGLMPPPESPPMNEVDWDLVEHVIGLRFPTDFREFVHMYGNAIWFDTFRPVFPGTTVAECEDYRRHLLELVEPMSFLYDESGPLDYKRFPDAGGLVPCLVDFDGSCFCWITVGHPDSWGILEWRRGPCILYPQHGVTRLICDWIEQVPPVQEIWNLDRLQPEHFKLSW